VIAEPGRSRDNPIAATFLSRRLVEQRGLGEGTWHFDFDLAGCGLDYVVGDSFGIFAKNDLGLVDQIIALLGALHTTEVRGRTLREVLTEDMSLSPAPDSLFELLSYLTGGAQREKARALAQGEDPDGDAATLDVSGAAEVLQCASAPRAFVEALELLQPRLYSISSSHNATPGKLSLTVDCVRYVVGKRKRLGLASTFLAERIQPGDEVKVYVQKAHGFALPQDPKTPIIMIGPGTGIRRSAPFCSIAARPVRSARTGCSSAISASETDSSSVERAPNWQRYRPAPSQHPSPCACVAQKYDVRASRARPDLAADLAHASALEFLGAVARQAKRQARQQA